jgi:hypothetical protein
MTDIFGGGNDTPPPPPPPPKPPAPMPDPDSPAAIEARRKAAMDVMGRAGRQSTILTAPKNRAKPAAPSSDYSGTTLGT